MRLKEFRSRVPSRLIVPQADDERALRSYRPANDKKRIEILLKDLQPVVTRHPGLFLRS
jgi:hypothetical protein